MATTKKAAAPAAAAPSFGFEPGLPWISTYIQEYKPTRLPADWHHLTFADNDMAPRFPAGSAVIAVPVYPGQALPPGVYAWTNEHSGKGAFVGRLPEARRGTESDGMLLSRDNNPAGIVCLLDWDNPAFRLYRVAFYSSYPAEQWNLAPQPDRADA
jgi:hypothetical protein